MDTTHRIDIADPHQGGVVITAADELTRVCYGLAKQSGWHDGPIAANPLRVPTRLMLIVSELGEAMEAHRKGKMDDHLPSYDGVTVELADAVIRIFDLAGAEGLPLSDAIAAKLAYNQRRADHKPENRAKAGGKAY